jgi:hypothetical protein
VPSKRIGLQFAAVMVVLAALLAGAYVVASNREITAADVREARTVVGRYLDGYERHDGHLICAQLTERVRAAIGQGRRGCAEELARRSWIPELVPRGRPRATVRRVPESGSGLAVALDHRDGFSIGIDLRRVDGRWLLDSEQTCVTPSCRP